MAFPVLSWKLSIMWLETPDLGGKRHPRAGNIRQAINLNAPYSRLFAMRHPE